MGMQIITVQDVWVLETVDVAATVNLTAGSVTDLLTIGGDVNIAIRPTNNMSIVRQPNLWIQDFSVGTNQAPYFNEFDSLTLMRHGFSDEIVKSLTAGGVRTVGDIAGMSKELVRRFRNPQDLNLTTICRVKNRATMLVNKCRVHYRGYDAEAYKTITFINVSRRQARVAPCPACRDG